MKMKTISNFVKKRFCQELIKIISELKSLLYDYFYFFYLFFEFKFYFTILFFSKGYLLCEEY